MPKKQKDLNLEIFEKDVEIVQLAQKKALKIIKNEGVSINSLTSLIKESAKRVLDFKKNFEQEGIIVEIINFADLEKNNA